MPQYARSPKLLRQGTAPKGVVDAHQGVQLTHNKPRAADACPLGGRKARNVPGKRNQARSRHRSTVHAIRDSSAVTSKAVGKLDVARPVPSKEVLGWCLATSFLLFGLYNLIFGSLSENLFKSNRCTIACGQLLLTRSH